MDMSDRIRAHTFSICAVDAASGQAGVAVASRCLSVGAIVPYSEPGVGAIATQAMANPRYGVRGLELLRKGLPAEEVVRRLTEEDFTVTSEEERFLRLYGEEGLKEAGVDFFREAGDGAKSGPHGSTRGLAEPWHPEGTARRIWVTSRIRQLGVVDRSGRAAVHTGARCQAWAGHLVGEGYCCQGNLLAGEAVVSAMAEAFEASRAKAKNLVGPLLAALRAGEAAGGDRRGRQAAAILVVREGGHWTGGDRWCDLRVDDHADPVCELARIVEKVGFAQA